MIIRIVKLSFREDKTADFIAHFEKVKWEVATFPGCHGMRLLRDLNNPNQVITYSEWESEEALEKYRVSDLFQSIWPTIKPWFSSKPEAWSCQQYFNGFH